MNRLLSGLTIGFVAAAVLAATGCQSYTTPGGPARLDSLGVREEDRKAMTDPAIRAALEKKPMVTFPAHLAVAHVQSPDYSNYHYLHEPQSGAYSVITTREVETEEDFEGIAKMPQISGVAPLKRILLRQTLNSDEELRSASAKLHCNLLLYYTFDTQFTTDTHVAPLGLISLGMFPNKNARATCTASAVLMDVNNGYVYSVLETTSKDEQLANAWTSGEAMDQVRQRVERDAFVKLVAEFKKEWVNVVAENVRR